MPCIKYYISNNGCDDNDGTTPETAIKTIDAIDKLPLKYGDAVLFERGSTFRLARQYNTVSGVIYGSYGEGQEYDRRFAETYEELVEGFKIFEKGADIYCED